MSPYTYGFNNPRRFIDPDGRLAAEAGPYGGGNEDFRLWVSQNEEEEQAARDREVAELRGGMGGKGDVYSGSNPNNNANSGGNNKSAEKEKNKEKNDGVDTGAELEKIIAEMLKSPELDMIITVGGEKFKIIKVAGPIITTLNTAHDAYLLAINEISGARFTFRLTGTGFSIIATNAVGPLAGPLVGAQMYFYEKMYDILKDWYFDTYRWLSNPNNFIPQN